MVDGWTLAERADAGCRAVAATVAAQREEAHRLVAGTGLLHQPQVASADTILAAMRRWEVAVAGHRAAAAALADAGGPDSYAEQALFAQVELDQFLAQVRGTRARVRAAAAWTAMTPAVPAWPMPPAWFGMGPAAAPGGLGPEAAAAWAELDERDAAAAKAAADHSIAVARGIAVGQSVSAAQHAKAIRTVL